LILNTALKTRNVIYLVMSLAVIGGIALWMWITKPTLTFYFTAGWVVIIATLLWGGNRLLTRTLDKMLPWSRSGNFRLFLQLALGLIYLLILINLTYVVLKVMFTTDPPTVGQIVTTNVFGAFIFIPAYTIYFSVHFLKHWRKSELETEKIQKENMRAQLNLLKSQLDPHFLFNNLNILSALIDQDQDRSKLFIEKFSEVYRALLRRQSDDLVRLTDELEFIHAYMYLMRTRFEDHIQFTENLRDNRNTRMIPPLTVQMLVENAIKHNTINETTPLAIQLLQLEDDYLIVSNTLNEKNEKTDRQGSGLHNIQNRYAYFTDKPVKIKKTETHFEVHIPLLEIETA
jgi:LytS/YehU family sensor histidine kinase